MHSLFGDICREQLGLLARAVFLESIFITQIVLARGLGEVHLRHCAGSCFPHPTLLDATQEDHTSPLSLSGSCEGAA